MIRQLIDILTVIAMVVILFIFIMELTPIYETGANIFRAGAYGF